ncbi:MAG TPA: hypothetical protein VND83_03025 [Acidimicrobiales bacterium]|nr:hypothetical protein [Acidimicrobiales bacterium]
MHQRTASRLLIAAVWCAVVCVGLFNSSFVGAATNWLSSLAASSTAESSAGPAITSATGNPVTFTAACASSSSESALLTWTTAGPGVTGYEVLVSSTVNGTFAVDNTQPVGTALTVTETYSGNTGKKFYRLEAKSANWPFPGTTIADARQAAVSGTNGGYLTMSQNGQICRANA